MNIEQNKTMTHSISDLDFFMLMSKSFLCVVFLLFYTPSWLLVSSSPCAAMICLCVSCHLVRSSICFFNTFSLCLNWSYFELSYYISLIFQFKPSIYYESSWFIAFISSVICFSNKHYLCFYYNSFYKLVIWSKQSPFNFISY